MGRTAFFVFAMLGCFVGASRVGAAPKSWEYGGAGQWKETQTTPASQPVVRDPVLDRAEQMLDGRRIDQAHDILLDWLKANPVAPNRDRAILLLARAYYANGDRTWCFYQCDELLDNYPDSKLYFPALELQYRVADDFLNGVKKRFLGLPILAMGDEGIEMLFRIQERSPGSPLAERALLRSADYYYHTIQYDLAADAYGAFVRIYPRSPDVPLARLRQAFSNNAQFRGPKYDATPLLDARAQFQDVQVRYPELAEKANVKQLIEDIDAQLAAKAYYDADYYRRTFQYKAAVFLFRQLIQTYPNSHSSQLAKQQLKDMPAGALNQPPPPPPAVIPTTGPSNGP
jgi:outer membrane assembly lipoprotein YfiO